MANALGTLFGDIASAIREKTGETGTMKPAEFPEKIQGIASGSSADGSSAECYFSQYLTLAGTSSVCTKISVNFGFEPDMIVLIPAKGCTISTSRNDTFFGLSNRYKEAYSKSIRNVAYYIYSSKVYEQSYLAGIETVQDTLPIYGADSTGFYLGKTPQSGDYLIFACKLV